MRVVSRRRMQFDFTRWMRRNSVGPMRPLADALLLGLQQSLDLGNSILLADVLDRSIKNIDWTRLLSLGHWLGRRSCR